jgi:hypothetical protein
VSASARRYRGPLGAPRAAGRPVRRCAASQLLSWCPRALRSRRSRRLLATSPRPLAHEASGLHGLLRGSTPEPRDPWQTHDGRTHAADTVEAGGEIRWSKEQRHFGPRRVSAAAQIRGMKLLLGGCVRVGGLRFPSGSSRPSRPKFAPTARRSARAPGRAPAVSSGSATTAERHAGPAGHLGCRAGASTTTTGAYAGRRPRRACGVVRPSCGARRLRFRGT